MTVAWPTKIKADNQVRTQFTHCIDIAPTVLEAVGLPEPTTVDGITTEPMDGTSFGYTFADAQAAERHTVQYFEMRCTSTPRCMGSARRGRLTRHAIAARQGREQKTMTAALADSSAIGGVRSLEVRWILPGQLESTVAGWFGRFPAQMEYRQDSYLLDPALGGLSMKVRAGRALEVKVYRGNPGIPEVAPGPGDTSSPGRNGRFPSARSARAVVTRLAGGRQARRGGLSGSAWLPGGPSPVSRGWPESRGARQNSPRSAWRPGLGGRSDLKRPAPAACLAAHCGPPPRWCSLTTCRLAWNSPRITPSPARSG